MNKFAADVLEIQKEITIPKIDIRGYAKYVLKNRKVEEKRAILGCIKSRMMLADGTIDMNQSSKKPFVSLNEEITS